MKSLILVAVVVYVLGCSSPRRLTRTQQRCVDSLERMVQTHWKYSTEKGYYELGDSLKAAIYRREFGCVRGVDTGRIVQIFGREKMTITEDFPYGWHDTIKAALEYPVSVSLKELAKQGKAGDQTTLRVYFDDRGKVRWMWCPQTGVIFSH